MLQRPHPKQSWRAPRRLADLGPALWLAAISLAGPAWSGCRVDEAQRRFSERPRPDAAIAALLSDCAIAGVRDYRIDLLLGVMARDDRRLAEAAALLEAAHAMAPREPAPALELAVTDEWRSRPAAARRLYQAVLAVDAASRGALLGLARVDRSQYRFAEARLIYRRLLTIDPSDTDARNGLAWIDLAEKRVEKARGEFAAVIAVAPGNDEAKAGLTGAVSAWRYQLDLATGFTSGDSGATPGGGADLLTYLSATSQVDVGYFHNGSQLRTSDLAVTTLLPLNDYHVAFNHIVPLSYHWSVSYDFRDHGALPAEHWLAANAGGYLAAGLQWFAGFRESFGAPQWDNQLLQAGLTAGLGHRWEVVGTGYYGAFTAVGLDGARLGRGHDVAFSADLNRQGPGNFFLDIGAGYSPDTKAVDVHGRVALPLGARNVIVFSLDRISAGDEYQGLTTFRHYF